MVSPFLEMLAEEERLFKKFVATGNDRVRVAGNLRSGLAINIDEVGGGGATGEGTPTGACCYDDGTCDDLTFTDCEDAGGTFQGLGTTCADTSCVGVCCEASGCVDNSTPDSCAADGGTWTDFGTTCADDPPPCPTGACCADDGSCSITTEVDCTGTYQGDGTVCDPNPCGTTCGACIGFTGFTTGLTYLTRDYTKILTVTCLCCAATFEECYRPTVNCTYTLHQECDPITGVVTTVETGRSCHVVGCVQIGDCTLTDYYIDMPTQTIVFPSGPSVACTEIVDSDSHAFCYQGFTHHAHCPQHRPGDDCGLSADGGTDVTVSNETTLSNPCTP